MTIGYLPCPIGRFQGLRIQRDLTNLAYGPDKIFIAGRNEPGKPLDEEGWLYLMNRGHFMVAASITDCIGRDRSP